jgi:hexosaminidase
VAGASQPGAITLVLSSKDAVPADPDGEGYRLSVTPGRVMLAAASVHGLYNGIQTIRQLVPVWINSPSAMPGPWSMPAVQITDYPRYTYRGVMLDIARHYESPAAVEQLIAQAAAYKINVFHLHLSDDQGFRIAINGFPDLTTIGGQGSVGTGGRTMDPGGYWTQAEYKAVVADAQAHFMTLIPEVDSPGHNNAITCRSTTTPPTRCWTATRRTSTAVPATRRSGTTPGTSAIARCAPTARTPGPS